MALTRIKIGELVDPVDERNIEDGNYPFYGINRDKEFMPTVADTSSLDNKKYKLVKTNRFVFSGMQTGRDQCIRIGMYMGEKTIVVSPAYLTFEVTNPLVLPEYLFMFFNSAEKDRYGAFLSDGSIRSNLDWDVFCDIEISLPSIDVQQKYVNIYKGMLENQRAYETGLEDLKLVCDATIEDLRKKYPCEKIGKYLLEISLKNADLALSKVLGISKDGFIEPKQDPGDLKNYFVFDYNCFVYSPPRINVGSIGLYKGFGKAICSPIYVVFKVNEEKILNPDYLAMWLSRSEFFRSTDFYSIASVRNNFSYDLMEEVEIPIPTIEMQQDIVNIFNSYNERKQINEALKNQIKNICPILIKGAMEEGNI